ncbi:MAG: radical SAM protein [Elusimicrobiota bacterium]
MSENINHLHQVTFGWDITYVCNYRCPYCTVWDQPTKLNLSPDQWMRVWNRLHEKYGRCYIYMSGGEPSRYPHFIDLVKELVKKHTVDVCTNLSWDVHKLVPEISPDIFRIAASFHPSFAKVDAFFEKAVHAKKYLPQRPEGAAVYYVASRAQIPLMNHYRDIFARGGLVLVPLPLVEDHRIGNDEREAKIIEEISPNKNDPLGKLEYQLRRLSPQGKLCRSGQRYAMIRGDGSVDRCSVYKDRQVGNILDENFELWDEPKVCGQEWCPYESQWLVDPK